MVLQVLDGIGDMVDIQDEVVAVDSNQVVHKAVEEDMTS